MKKRNLAGIVLGVAMVAWPLENIADHTIPQSYYQTQDIQEEIPPVQAEPINFEIPKYLLTSVKSGRCSEFVRKMAEANGRKVIGADAKNLHLHNPNMPYDSCKLEPYDIIQLTNPSWDVSEDGAVMHHAALYLGNNEKGEPVFAHQMGSYESTSTINQLEKLGYVPKTIIPTKAN